MTMRPSSRPRGRVIQWAQHALVLLADRGVFVPAYETLLVADPHFGKANVFAQVGIPVPSAITSATLARIQRMVDETRARRLIILGDLWHGRGSRDDPSVQELQTWRRGNPALSVEIIRGNHDRLAGEPQQLDAQYHESSRDLGPLHLRHAPDSRAGQFVIAGHLHPVIRLRDLGQVHVRLACFHVQARSLTIPAVGAFTGGRQIRPGPGDRVFVCMGTQVTEVPVR
jgi:DNA ligase-associated metallophosphoesterase